jgi:hypothetical protein
MHRVPLAIALLLSFLSIVARPSGQCHDASNPGGAPLLMTPGSTPSTTEPGGEQDRIVFVNLSLRKSGVVQEAKALSGPAALREPAIHAAKHRKYKDALHSWPFSNQIMVAVTFPKDMIGAPEIRQAMPAGVPGCVYATRVRVSPEIMQSNLIQRVNPIYPAGEKVDTLVLRLNIDKNGNVTSAERVSGPDALAPAAIGAVKQWKYRPYELNGVVVEVQTTVELKPLN